MSTEIGEKGEMKKELAGQPIRDSSSRRQFLRSFPPSLSPLYHSIHPYPCRPVPSGRLASTSKMGTSCRRGKERRKKGGGKDGGGLNFIRIEYPPSRHLSFLPTYLL